MGARVGEIVFSLHEVPMKSQPIPFTSDSSQDGYFPDPAFYDPKISVEQWRELLRDPQISPPSILAMLKSMLAYGGEATCAQLAQGNELSAQYYNSQGMNFGRRVKQRLNLPDCIDQGVNRLFVIPFLGRYVDGGKHYAWRLRDELKQALESMEIPSFDTTKEMRQFDMEKNIILYGPPGTGKTYHTHIYAVAIIEARPLDEVASENHDDVRERFNEYRQQGLIEFTTFHQSYSYEDFVEGIRPVIDEDESSTTGTLAYRVESGVFKRFCEKAETTNFTESLRAETSPSDNEFLMNNSPVIWKVSLAGTGNNPVRIECLNNGHIRIGWDLYGKEITEETEFSKGGKAILDAFINKMQLGDIVVSCYTDTMTDAIGIVTGEYEWHDEYSEYKRVRKVHWLIKNIRQNILGLNDGTKMTLSTVYQLKNVNLDELLSIVKEHLPSQKIKPAPTTTENKRRVFIIDEINRGNIAGIFGELITLIEPSKRLGAKEALRVRLPYSRKEFGVPEDIYILGTMNTADRSLTGLDIALRRRFAFKKMPPCPELLSEMHLCDSGFSVANLLSVMNKRISALLDQDHCIGHAPFLHLPKGAVPVGSLAKVFQTSIIPLLEEYFFEDWNKIRLVLNDHRKSDPTLQFVVAVDDAKDLFGNEYSFAQKEWALNTDAFYHMEAYVHIIDVKGKCSSILLDDAGESLEEEENSSDRFSPPQSFDDVASNRDLVSEAKQYENHIFVKFKSPHFAVYDANSRKKLNNQIDYCKKLVASDAMFRGITFKSKEPTTYEHIREILNRLPDDTRL